MPPLLGRQYDGRHRWCRVPGSRRARSHRTTRRTVLPDVDRRIAASTSLRLPAAARSMHGLLRASVTRDTVALGAADERSCGTACP
jgi:hypothetical protein